MSITSDTGPFSIVPEWLLDADVSDRAVRLYCVLGRYADDTGACWPSRRTLAARLRCSTDTIDRAKEELLTAGALIQAGQARSDGSQTSNRYILIRAVDNSGESAPVPRGGRMDAAGPGVMGAAPRTRASKNENQESTRAQSPGDNYRPTDAQCELAQKWGIDVKAEVEHWLDWCKAEGRTYKDVSAGFSTWLRREVKSRVDRAQPVATVHASAVPGLVLPPARHEMCEVCEQSVLACECGRLG